MNISAGKLIYVIFLSSLFSLSIFAQNKSEREQRDYLGKVKTVRTEIIEYEFDDNDKLKAGRRELDSFERFDETGNLLEEISYSDGKILISEKHNYSGGKLIETFLTHSKYLNLPDKRIYRYDDAGNLIEENGYDADGKLVNQSIYVYDDRNRKIRRTSISYHPGEYSKPHTYTYGDDEKGRLIEEKAFFGKGDELSPTDSLGRAHKRILSYGDSAKWETALYFNTKNELVKKTKLKYDSKGNEIEDITFNPDEKIIEIIRYEYKFDKAGNWIEEKDFRCAVENGKEHCQLEEIHHRKIEYFK